MFASSPSSPPWNPPPPAPVAPKKRRKTLIALAAAAAAALLVVGGVAIVAASRDTEGGGSATTSARPTADAQPAWRPITDARTALVGAAATQSDGTIWIFGGMDADDRVSGTHEGYDPAIDSWKGGEALPVPVQRAMSVTWQDTPVVLGGWRTEGANTKVATDQVWRVVNSRWVQLPPLLQPRAAAAAALVGDRIVVTGGVDASGEVLDTTEVFDGSGWKLGAPMPTPRQLLASASDGKLVYAVGGTDGTVDLATVEAYDPAVDTWTTMPAPPEPRSDVGAAVTDARLVAVGGTAGGRPLRSVTALDLTTATWTDLPDLDTARHGAAVTAVGKTVYAIGGATGAGDGQATSSAEALKLAPRTPQPAAQWRSLPDAPTPRLMTAWTVLDDKIWLIGGIREGETLQSVETYDPRTQQWQPQPSLPIPLNHAAAATYRGEVVVIGGATDTITQASDKVFALRDDTWVELPSLQHARAAPAAVVVDDKLVVVGWQNDKQIVPQTEVFDGTSWTQASDIPTPREHLAAVSDGVYVYTVGGRFLSADENSAAFERFDPASGNWEKLPDMPTPRGSYGPAFVDGRIVVVGGEEPTRVLATVEMYDIAQPQVEHTGRDQHAGARPSSRGRRLHRLLHRGRRPADPRRAGGDGRGAGLHVAPSRSWAGVTALRRSASLASRTRRSPSVGMANLS